MIPNWRFNVVEVPITVTLDAYSADDVVGGLLTSDALGQLSGGGYIQWIRLVDGATQAEAYLIYVFSSLPSTIADAAGFTPLEADWLKCVGCVSLAATDYDTDGTEADMAFTKAVDRKTNDYVSFPPIDSDRLYFYLVAVTTPDYAAAVDLTMHIGVWVA